MSKQQLWNQLEIPVNTWFDGTFDLRLFTSDIFGKIDLKSQSSTFKTAILPVNSDFSGFYAQTGFNSLKNYLLNAGYKTNHSVFHLWGGYYQNKFKYLYETRKSEFNEDESKLGLLTAYTVHLNSIFIDILSITSAREAQGGGVVEYPSASRNALSRTVSQITGISLYPRGSEAGSWIWQPVINIRNRLNYQDYSNPSPLVGRSIDHQYLDDSIAVQVKNAWTGSYPFDLSFDYRYLIFKDISQIPLLNHASEHLFKLSADSEIPIIWQSHFIDISINAGIELSEDHILPVAGLEIGYQYADWIQSTATVKYLSRRPDYSEKYYISENIKGNPNLTPEQGIYSDIHFSISAPAILDTLNMGLSGFLYHYHDAIHWIPVTSYLTAARNLSDVTGYGGTIGFEAGHHWKQFKIDLKSDYTYTHLTTDSYDIPYQFRHRLTTDLMLEYGPLRIDFDYQYYHNGKYGFTDVSVLPDRHLLDISVNYRFRSLTLEFYIENLLNDQSMSDARQRPLPGTVAGFWLPYQR